MRKIINPYNFVPFGDDIETNKLTREEAYRGEKGLQSGWLDVKMIPSSPIIIPDGAHPVEVKPDYGKGYHKEYDFMHRYYEDGSKEYYIPGSSIRGMIRSVYEAATDSCVPVLLADAEKPISKRVPLYAALKQRGLLSCEYDENGNSRVWKLYSAYAETETVEIQEENATFHLMQGTKEITDPAGSYIEGKGVLQYNIPVDIKKEYHIAYLRKNSLVHEWEHDNDEPYDLLNSVLCRDNVKGNQANRNEKPAKDIQKALENAKQSGGMVPVYYFKVVRKENGHDEEMIYLSNSSAGRIAQKRKWADIMGIHKPCAGPKLCPACLLLGTHVKEYGLKSHIRVTDALPERGQTLKLKNVTLDILGEPRPSAFEFYLERPEGASYWNFDFYGRTEKDRNGVGHTHYYDMERALPRGRKMYWHGNPRISHQKGKLNATMSAAVGTTFEFRVYFDEISESQLQSLIWVLTLGDNREKSPYQHKLGHAKPLGYGSVKLIVTGGKLRKVSRDGEDLHVAMEPITVGENPQSGIDLRKDYVKDLLKMSRIDAPGDIPVEYPVGPDGKIFSWFSENRIRAEEVVQLPKPSDEDISIEVAEKKRRFAAGAGKKTSYKEGDRVDGKVTRYNKDRSGMYVKVGSGEEKFVYFKNTNKRVRYGQIDKCFPVDTEVTLEYRGKDGKNKEQWHVV